ncbi:uncharacterized protein LODBEIA_P05860 [Lodderomyces beijingensis]|uniref:PX domain-containing protein n=1 Tax=Lodderomyces beijingensis TaxID=1775926 RepID=A0ABP0ZJL3_9ASCO
MPSAALLKTKPHRSKRDLRNITISNPLTTTDEIEFAKKIATAQAAASLSSSSTSSFSSSSSSSSLTPSSLSSSLLLSPSRRSPRKRSSLVSHILHAPSPSEQLQIILISKYRFNAECPKEISMQPRCFYKLIEKVGNGWLKVCQVENGSNVGLCPASYMDIAINDSAHPITLEWLHQYDPKFLAEEDKTSKASEPPIDSNIDEIYQEDGPSREIWFCLKVQFESKIYYAGRTYFELRQFHKQLVKALGGATTAATQLPHFPRYHDESMPTRLNSSIVAELRNLCRALDVYFKQVVSLFSPSSRCQANQMHQINAQMVKFLSRQPRSLVSHVDGIMLHDSGRRLSPSAKLVDKIFTSSSTSSSTATAALPACFSYKPPSAMDFNYSYSKTEPLSASGSANSSAGTTRLTNGSQNARAMHAPRHPIPNVMTSQLSTAAAAAAAAKRSPAPARRKSLRHSAGSATPAGARSSYSDREGAAPSHDTSSPSRARGKQQESRGIVLSSSSNTLSSYSSLIDGYDEESLISAELEQSSSPSRFNAGKQPGKIDFEKRGINNLFGGNIDTEADHDVNGMADESFTNSSNEKTSSESSNGDLNRQKELNQRLCPKLSTSFTSSSSEADGSCEIFDSTNWQVSTTPLTPISTANTNTNTNTSTGKNAIEDFFGFNDPEIKEKPLFVFGSTPQSASPRSHLGRARREFSLTPKSTNSPSSTTPATSESASSTGPATSNPFLTTTPSSRSSVCSLNTTITANTLTATPRMQPQLTPIGILSELDELEPVESIAESIESPEKPLVINRSKETLLSSSPSLRKLSSPLPPAAATRRVSSASSSTTTLFTPTPPPPPSSSPATKEIPRSSSEASVSTITTDTSGASNGKSKGKGNSTGAGADTNTTTTTSLKKSAFPATTTTTSSSNSDMIKLKIFLNNSANDIIVLRFAKMKLRSTSCDHISMDYVRKKLSAKLMKMYHHDTFSSTPLQFSLVDDAQSQKMARESDLVEFVMKQDKCSLKLM